MLRVIGEKLNKLEGKNSAFKEHLHELEADYKRVSGHFDDILASHEKTFLSVRRSFEQGCKSATVYVIQFACRNHP